MNKNVMNMSPWGKKRLGAAKLFRFRKYYIHKGVHWREKQNSIVVRI